MKKQLRIIFLLMVACILGINLFQGYWLYNTYQLNLSALYQSVNESLIAALKQQHLKDADRTIRYHVDSLAQRHLAVDVSTRVEKRELSAAPTAGWVQKKKMVAGEGPEQTMFMFRYADSASLDSAVFFADTLAQEISSLLILNRFYERDFDLARFDSIYAAELGMRGVEIPYQLDTNRIEKAGVPIAVKEKAFIEKGTLYSSRIPANSLSDLVVQARFSNPVHYLLGQMGGLIAASFLLFLLTTGCMVYMLRTILTQKRLSEVKSDFINNMTHELKTPIATVSAAVEAMQHFDAMADKDRTRDYLDISRKELTRLGDLVEKVLSIAVEERREPELHAEEVNLLPLIGGLVETHRLRSDREITLRFEHQLDDPIVRVDRTHFSNAVSNLIDNAIKYSPHAADILIRCTREEGWLRVSVKDNGIGIPRDHQKSIFDQFFRVPSGNIHEVKGFGLGLSYVKRIIEKHGGNITVSSELDKGSEFIINLPAKNIEGSLL